MNISLYTHSQNLHSLCHTVTNWYITRREQLSSLLTMLKTNNKTPLYKDKVLLYIIFTEIISIIFLFSHFIQDERWCRLLICIGKKKEVFKNKNKSYCTALLEDPSTQLTWLRVLRQCLAGLFFREHVWALFLWDRETVLVSPCVLINPI